MHYMDISTSVSVSIGTYPLSIPDKLRGLRAFRSLGDSAYPFEQLEVDGWFVVANRTAATVQQAIQRYYFRHGREKRFVQRIGPGGHPTVWRVK